MELQYGHTMRLHHIDFPDVNQAVQSVENWEQTNPNPQLEVRTPAHRNQSFTTSKVKERFSNTTQQDQGGSRGGRADAAVSATGSVSGYRSIKLPKNLKNTTNSETIQTNFSQRICVKQTPLSGSPNAISSISIECDVLDSFQEFATFLELQNPICPAELVDTPEKLMNVLCWDV